MADYDPDRDLDMEVLAAVSGPTDGTGGGDAGDSESSDDFDDEDDAAGEFDAEEEDEDDNGDDGDEEDENDVDDDDDDDDYGDQSLGSGNHPDDPNMDEDDGDLEDDDDDDDYDVKGKKKKASLKAKGKTSKASQKTSKSAKGVARTKTARAIAASKKKKSGQRRKSGNSVAANDQKGPEEAFQYKYDEQGYGDAEDVEKVMAMNEIERETLLAERIEERQKQEHIWRMTRQMHAKGTERKGSRVSSRARSSRTDSALEALHAEKVAKQASAQKRALDEVSDDEESDLDDAERLKKARRDVAGEKEMNDAEEDGMARDTREERDLEFRDLVVPSSGDDKAGYVGDLSPTHLFLPRDKLVELVSEAYFERAVTGLFVKFRRAVSDGSTAYVLCRIGSITKSSKIYKVADRTGSKPKRTNMLLNLTIADQAQPNVSIELCSNSVPTETEFETYKKRVAQRGKALLSRSEVLKLRAHAMQMTTSRKSVAATEEELKAHQANQEILYPETVNWTKRKAELSLDLTHWRQLHDVARRSEKKEEMDRAQERIDEFEKKLADIESRQGSTPHAHSSRNLDVFQTLARKNVALNSANERLAAGRRALETTTDGVNPFARFDTSGMSYFSVKSKNAVANNATVDSSKADANELSAANGVSGSASNVKSTTQRPLRGGPDDWKLSLRIKSGNVVSMRRPISDHPLVPAYGGAFEGLDDFDRSPEELSELYPVGPVVPPSIDALYANQVSLISDSSAVAGGKAISLEEYNRLRAE